MLASSPSSTFSQVVGQLMADVAFTRYSKCDAATVDSVCSSHDRSMAFTVVADAVAVKFSGGSTMAAWTLLTRGNTAKSVSGQE